MGPRPRDAEALPQARSPTAWLPGRRLHGRFWRSGPGEPDRSPPVARRDSPTERAYQPDPARAAQPRGSPPGRHRHRASRDQGRRAGAGQRRTPEARLRAARLATPLVSSVSRPGGGRRGPPEPTARVPPLIARNPNGHAAPSESRPGGIAQHARHHRSDRPSQFSGPLPEAVDVAVIGGGIMGVSTAWFLAGAGKRVLVCEKGRVAGEQSCRNWGWIRQQGRDRAELPIMMEVEPHLARARRGDRREQDLTFTPAGQPLAGGERGADGQVRAAGTGSRGSTSWIRGCSRPRKHAALAPGDHGADGSARLQTASDGRGEPLVAVPALARAAAARGVTVIEDCAVRTAGVDRRDGSRAIVTETRAGRGPTRCCSPAARGRRTSRPTPGLDLPQLMVRSTAARTHVAQDGLAPNIVHGRIRHSPAGPTAAIRIATGDLAEHYVSANSFRYFTKFLKLLKISAKDVRLRPWPPAGISRARGHRNGAGPATR